MQMKTFLSTMALFSLCLCGCGNAKKSAENINESGDVREVQQYSTAERKKFSNSGFDVKEHTGDDAFAHSNKFGKTYRHSSLLLSYSEDDEQAEWVCYELTKEEATASGKRSNNFMQDPIIPTGSAQPYEYRNSGYDKGHLAPSADMKFDRQAMQNSFYMSNITPQTHKLNTGIWNNLEQQCRFWARVFNRIHIVTGPVLNIDPKKKKKLTYTDYGIEKKSNITIPEHYYKIVFDNAEPEIKMIAFLIPNTNDVKGSYFDYAVSVDHLEELTGIDFFSNLPLKVQEQYESSVDVEPWKKFTNKGKQYNKY